MVQSVVKLNRINDSCILSGGDTFQLGVGLVAIDGSGAVVVGKFAGAMVAVVSKRAPLNALSGAVVETGDAGKRNGGVMVGKGWSEVAHVGVR